MRASKPQKHYWKKLEGKSDKPHDLVLITTMQMPFGKYKGRLLCDLPVYYLEWLKSKGFPSGQLGNLLSTIYEIKINGLEYLLEPIKQKKQAQ